MTKCVFCGSEESPYRGVHLIKNDGSVSFFCSGKCRKNALNLGRDRKKIKWTEAYGITQEKKAASDKRAVDRAEVKAQETADKAKEAKKK